MNKMEYLERLESCLKWKVSKRELDDIMRDYAEYFEEGRRQSKADSEISAKLGDPEIVAQQIIEESRQPKNSYQEPHVKEHKKHNHRFLKKAKRSLASLIGQIFYFIVVFPIAVISMLIPIVILFTMIFIVSTFGIVSASSLLGGIFLMIGSGMCFVLAYPQIGLTALFATVAAISFGICFSCLTVFCARKFWYATRSASRWSTKFVYNILSIPYKKSPEEKVENKEYEPENVVYEETEEPPYQSPTDPLYHNLQEIMKNKNSEEEATTVSEQSEPPTPSTEAASPEIEKENECENVNLTLADEQIVPHSDIELLPTENNPPKKLFPALVSGLEEGIQNA